MARKFTYNLLSDENKAVVDHLPLEYLEHLYSLDEPYERGRFLNLCRTKRKPEADQRELLSLTHVIEPQPEPKKQRQSKIGEFLK